MTERPAKHRFDDHVLLPDEAALELRGIATAIDGTSDLVLELSHDRRVSLPPSVGEALARVIAYLAQGSAVAISPVDQYLSTQEAAQFLGVSRPHFIALLDSEGIPFQRTGGPGTHRRIALRDLLAYRDAILAAGARLGRERLTAERAEPVAV
jgi:excisionase family DNA binding protein